MTNEKEKLEKKEKELQNFQLSLQQKEKELNSKQMQILNQTNTNFFNNNIKQSKQSLSSSVEDNTIIYNIKNSQMNSQNIDMAKNNNNNEFKRNKSVNLINNKQNLNHDIINNFHKRQKSSPIPENKKVNYIKL